jgi:phosphoserine phosphatase
MVSFPLILSVIAPKPSAGVAQYAREIEALLCRGPMTWLSEDRAFEHRIEIETIIDGKPATSAAAAAKGFYENLIHLKPEGLLADLNVVPDVGVRRKKLLVADMDSTIISCECLDEIADFIGVKAHVSAITERAMRGEIAFEPALRERVALLKGLPVHRLARVYAERVRLNPGAKAMVATMKAHGARTCLVSGGFTYFTQRVAEDAGFDDHQANVLLDDGTALVGVVSEPILGREAKLAALQLEVQRLGITAHDALCVGDGANDLAMIQHAGLGVAYHAKPVVAEAAGARVDHGDLTTLLYLQGYSDDEIVGG